MALEEEDLAGDPGSGIRCFLEKCHIENMYADANSPLFMFVASLRLGICASR